MNKFFSINVKEILYNISLSYDYINSTILKDNNNITNKEYNDINYNKIIDIFPPGIYINIKNIEGILINKESEFTFTKQTKVAQKLLSKNNAIQTHCSPMVDIENYRTVIGREKEIFEIEKTLSRKDKRGVILIGPPGCGKTAIVKEIARRSYIHANSNILPGIMITELNIAKLLSKEEHPLRSIINILETATKMTGFVLFIDEIHQLLSSKLNDVLKPYLTESIRFIGCTTADEFHSIIASDPALERRFRIIYINEPNINETIEMVRGSKESLEKYHKIKISNAVITYAVNTATRFLGNRINPDKSFDVLDLACTLATNKYELFFNNPAPSGKSLESKLIEHTNSLKSTYMLINNELTTNLIDQSISGLTNIDMENINNSLNFDYVKKYLKEKIIGQNEAIAICSNLTNMFKYSSPNRQKPITKLALLGPPGIGKTYLAKEISKILFGENKFVEYDMSGLTSPHQLSELKGAPPGYVGYGNSNPLIKTIRNSPQCVLYIKNIHKADSSIIKYFLSAIKKGELIESSGKIAKLNNCIIIFGITLEEKELEIIKNNKKKSVGIDISIPEIKSLEERLKPILQEDLLNSLDNVCLMNNLTKDDLSAIFDLNINSYLEQYLNVNLDIHQIKTKILESATNAHKILNDLSSIIPKEVFNITLNQGETNE